MGGCIQSVQTAWQHLGSAVETTWLVLGGPNCPFGINGVRNKRSHLVGPPFPAFKASSLATAGWHFSGVIIGSLLIGGCG